MGMQLDFKQIDLKKIYKEEIVIFILANYGSLTPKEILERNRDLGFNKSRSSIYRYVEILKNAKKIAKEKNQIIKKLNSVPLTLTKEGEQCFINILKRLDIAEFVNELNLRQIYREIELFFSECVFSLSPIEKRYFKQLYTELNFDYFTSKIPKTLYNYMLLYITFRHPDTFKGLNLSDYISKLPFSSHLNLDIEKEFMKFIKVLSNNKDGPKLKKLMISIHNGEEDILVLENNSFIKKMYSLINSQIDSIIYDKTLEQMKSDDHDEHFIISRSKNEINHYFKDFLFVQESLEKVIRDRIYDKFVKKIPKVYKNGVIRSLRKSIGYESFKNLFNRYPIPLEKMNNCSRELLNKFIENAMEYLDKKENEKAFNIVEEGLLLFENSYELNIILTLSFLELGRFKYALDAIERAEELFDRFYPHEDDKKVMIIELKMKTLIYNSEIPFKLFEDTLDLYEYQPNVIILDLEKSYNNPWIQIFINNPKIEKQLNLYRKLGKEGKLVLISRKTQSIKNKLISK